jgi:hypothetical protein
MLYYYYPHFIDEKTGRSLEAWKNCSQPNQGDVASSSLCATSYPGHTTPILPALWEEMQKGKLEILQAQERFVVTN